MYQKNSIWEQKLKFSLKLIILKGVYPIFSMLILEETNNL
jgi:hypothetical protein